MKNKYLYMTIAVLLIAMVIAIQQCNSKQASLKNLKENLAGVDSQHVQVWKDKYDHEHYLVKDLTGEIGMMKIVHAKIYDSLSKVLKIKAKDISGITRTDLVIHDTLLIPLDPMPQEYITLHCDTFKQHYQYSDTWTKMEINIKDQLAKVDYTTQDSLYSVTYKKHVGFLNLSRASYTDWFSSNPRSSIKGLKSLKSVQREKRFGLGVQVGYGLSGSFKLEPYIGIGLQYNIIRF